MKKIFLFAITALLFTACINDDSTYGDDSIKIDVSGLEESYSVLSLNDLVITPTITTNLQESDFEYEWSYYKDETSLTGEKRYANVISTDRNLNYNVALADGKYVLIYKVKSKSTGYTQTVTTTINVSSSLSQGFYILKENSEGNTDVDLYNTVSGELFENVISGMQDEAIPGKPRAMDVLFNMAYLDPDTEDKGSCTGLCITTENNEVRWIRASDGRTVSDASKCHYEEIENEIPYRTVHGFWSEYYITNNGCYSTYDGSQGTAGIFGASEGTGGSVHVITSSSLFYGMIIWDEQNRSLYYSDYNGSAWDIYSNVAGYDASNTNYDCLFAGNCSASGEMLVYMLQDRSNTSKKVLYYLSAGWTGVTVDQVKELDSNSHIAKASLHAISAYGATIIYSVDNNKVYTYDIANDNPEKELSFTGLSSSETITYIANRYFYGSTTFFDYLIVGTQSGNTYKLYFYETVGGEPVGSPVLTITGEGKLRKLDYADPLEGGATAVPVLDD